jgi:hexosaminidase
MKMMAMLKRCRQWLLLGWALALPASAAPDAGLTAPMRLSWEIESNLVTPEFPAGRTRALLSLTNLDSKALPAQGWSIYFSSIAGVVTGPAEGHVTLERVNGALFRLRPREGFPLLASGQTARMKFIHPELMVMIDKAPQAPYLVYDSEPNIGLAITDYKLLTPTRPEQLGPIDPPLMTAQALFARYQGIADLPIETLPPVFPTPLKFERGTGQLHWSSSPRIIAAPGLKREAAFAAELLRPHFAVGRSFATESALRLSFGVIAGQTQPEAYELTIDKDRGLLLTGASAAGLYRGLQTLRGILPLPGQAPSGLKLAAMHLIDAPRFEYRGVMLDVARNFQPKAAVLRLLDLMSRYKLNKLHLHLTDDEGWRIEIAAIPELTRFAARRGHSADGQAHLPPAYGSGPDVGDGKGSGFYTQSDYVEILKFAAARHIEVIPEIEMPGHARAAVKAMQSRYKKLAVSQPAAASKYLLSDPADKSVYSSAQGYTDHLIDPGLPSTYAFIEQVVTELTAMHKRAGTPLRMLHIGGDEVPAGAWEKSPASLALMQSLKLPSTLELWDYFYARVDKILRRQGLSAAGWEELGARRTRIRGEDKLLPNPQFVNHGFTLFVWQNLWGAEDLAYRLANAGYKTVLAPVTHLYFDLGHLKDPAEPGHNWGGYIDLDNVYDFMPLDMLRKSPLAQIRMAGKDELSDFGRKQILGLQATLFAETVRDATRLDYMLMPRLLGLAERAWAPDPTWVTATSGAEQLHQAAYSIFINQVSKQLLPRLDAEQAGLAYRIAPPGLKQVNGEVLVNQQMPGFALRFTTDGSLPTQASPLVSGPIRAKGVIQVAAFNRNGRSGRASSILNP